MKYIKISIWVLYAAIILFIFNQCSPPAPKGIKTERFIEFNDTIVEWTENEISDSLNDILLHQFSNHAKLIDTVVLYPNLDLNTLIGIREPLMDYIPKQDSCTIIEMYYKKHDMKYWIWFRQDSTNQLKAVNFFCYPNSWNIEF